MSSEKDADTKQYGILFTDEMVRAILDGRKTVTRRTSEQWAKRKVDDLLWVRECFTSADMGPVREGGPIAYRSDFSAERIRRDRLGPWKPGIHMPRWASRLTLRITDLRCEDAEVDGDGKARDGAGRTLASWFEEDIGYPLPFVDDAEARREGVADRAAYLELWRSINKGAMPETVWRIAFEVVR